MASPIVAAQREQVSTSSRKSILLEVIFVLFFAFLSKILISPWTWKFAGPISLAGVVLLITAIGKLRGFSWMDLGLKRLTRWKSVLMVFPQTLLTGVVFAAAVALTFGIAHVLELEFLSSNPEGVEQRWGDVRGNLRNYIIWLIIVWTAAAFGEEMVFRGYLITRLEKSFSNLRLGSLIAVVVSALIFGYGHFYYQGLRGLIVTSVIGVVFGSLFLVFKRSLWPLVLWHGTIDTLTFTALYSDFDV